MSRFEGGENEATGDAVADVDMDMITGDGE